MLTPVKFSKLKRFFCLLARRRRRRRWKFRKAPAAKLGMGIPPRVQLGWKLCPSPRWQLLQTIITWFSLYFLAGHVWPQCKNPLAGEQRALRYLEFGCSWNYHHSDPHGRNKFQVQNSGTPGCEPREHPTVFFWDWALVSIMGREEAEEVSITWAQSSKLLSRGQVQVPQKMGSDQFSSRCCLLQSCDSVIGTKGVSRGWQV